ncbi:bifunctional folylpolyglutamate synthase/dihydrofolate synthase [Geobacter benzoatilyticus]|uniref:Dihydrofolate synthase/folylpolyglutamate synthase n=1 Tax=Geobacter benzoatilyticus TaxID=2815309 RepID=A0ABX7Q089_9BACT|nr:folylpolyglutamate synthase/dihydrofolate synthase family protein [Geobacter benzoatilyticus]QSV44570.1 bifunctional folylpolyglutamate synthase/dihydrofolate synthase [Geobacter benzoatilyticus]
MTYEETLAYIYGLRRFGIKPGLSRVKTLLERLGNPHERLRSVHVAGTNGKGSTAAFLASIMTTSGRRTGLFTSPHLSRFTERICIDGTEITADAVCRLAGQVLAAAPDGTTFFEIVTAMALLYFAEEHVDIAILEAGMGGGSDATSIAGGTLSVITPVALDHCEWLGDSLADIAREKGGIIKPGRPVVLSAQPQEVLLAIQERCRDLDCSLVRFGTDFGAGWKADGLSYHGIERRLSGLEPGIGGRYQAVNAATALAAAELLAADGHSLTDEALRTGIAHARWPGRMELFAGNPAILLDGAHNPAGAHALAESLGDVPRRRLIVVAGVMGDKDAEGILAPILPLAHEVIAVTPAVERGCPSADLAALCRGQGVPSEDGGSVSGGLALARSRAEADDLILVCGSLYVVGEARSLLLDRHFEPFRG